MMTPRGEDETIAAGPFSPWLADMLATLRGEQTSDVPCGPCTACCRSGQFVHIEPDEHAALGRIPSTLLFPAPRLPAGHVLMGYDEHGRCPMLVDERCSIYEDRPRTCRTYDCRVFAAADVEPDEAQPDIAERVRRWRFDHPDERDQIEHEAVRAAARFVRARGGELPGGGPTTPVQQAVVAIRVHRAFLSVDADGAVEVAAPGAAEVSAQLGAGRSD